MQRKQVTLTRDAVLWEQGDAARDLAVVEQGKLGIRTETGVLVGVAFPGMVLGESALLDIDGPVQRRTATVFALEDQTVAVEFPAAHVRESLENGEDDVTRKVLLTLVGQICRNLAITLTARRGQPLVEDPLRGLAQGLAATAPAELSIRSWDRFLFTVRFLHHLRDYTDRVIEAAGPHVSERSELVASASGLLGELFHGQEVLPMLEDFLRAEKERTERYRPY